MSTTRPPSFDERYAAPVEASRRGAHRARPHPLAAALPVVAGAAVVLLVVVGGFTLLRDRGTESDSSRVAASAPNPGPSATAAASAGPAPTASVLKAPQPSATEPAEEESEAAAEVDKTAELVVLNSTGISGLAKKVARELEDDGWSVGETSNASGRLTTTRVYYAEDSDAATAEAVVSSLGFGEAKKSAAKAKDGVTVVLGRDAS